MTGRLWIVGAALVSLTAALAAGCDGKWNSMNSSRGGTTVSAETAQAPPAPQRIEVQPPLSELLPKAIQVHEFTTTKKFNGKKGGIELLLQVTDGFGSRNKAFGQFRFELRQFLPAEPEPAGELIRSWQIDLRQVARNKQHWQNTLMLYEFRLECDQPLVIGNRYVLVAMFDSPYTDRLFTKRVFVARAADPEPGH